MNAANLKALKLDMDLKTLHHELRTPLTGILGIAHFLNSEDLSDTERKEYTVLLIEASNRLASFIEKVLASPSKDITLDKFDFLRFKATADAKESLALLLNNESTVEHTPGYKI